MADAMLVDNESLTANESLSTEVAVTSSPTITDTKLVSDEILYWGQIVCYIGLCGTISILGICTNILNIIVFIRQGVFKDSNTVSLLALSVSDFCSLVTLLWLSVFFLMSYLKPTDLPFDPISMAAIGGGRPHVMFVQITSWLTVYIAFERCMCVVLPFKVGRIFTPKRAAIFILCLVVIIPSYGYIPLYFVEHLRWRNYPNTNKTIIAIYRTNDYKAVMAVCRILNAPVSRSVTLTLVFLFTQITAIRVNASRKWRMTAARTNIQGQNTADNSKTTEEPKHPEGSGINKDIGNRDKRLIKMIRAICVIFMACLTPNLIFIVLSFVVPEIKPRGRYSNMYFLMYGFSFVTESVNATVNIFVYYKMSSKYRSEFMKLFRKGQTAND